MSDKYEMNGQIKLIDSIQTFDSGFQKREFVITTEDDKYPQDIKFEVVKDKCEGMDEFNAGEHVTVAFNIRGNEFKDKFYVNLQAWMIKHQEGKETVSDAVSAGNQAIVEQVAASVQEDDSSDSLPF